MRYAQTKKSPLDDRETRECRCRPGLNLLYCTCRFVYLIRCDKVAQTQEQQCVRKSRSGTNNLHKYQEEEKEKKDIEKVWVKDGEKCMQSLHLEEVGRLR